NEIAVVRSLSRPSLLIHPISFGGQVRRQTTCHHCGSQHVPAINPKCWHHQARVLRGSELLFDSPFCSRPRQRILLSMSAAMLEGASPPPFVCLWKQKRKRNALRSRSRESREFREFHANPANLS